MSRVSSNHPQESGTSATSSIQLDKLSRPGWTEVIVSLFVFAIIRYGGGSQLGRPEFDPVINGLSFTALSGVAGIAVLVATVVLRIRCHSEAAPVGAFKQ